MLARQLCMPIGLAACKDGGFIAEAAQQLDAKQLPYLLYEAWVISQLAITWQQMSRTPSAHSLGMGIHTSRQSGGMEAVYACTTLLHCCCCCITRQGLLLQ